MLIKAREDGFREAMEIFGQTVTPEDAEGEPEKTHVRGAGISAN
jgi:hypothetical protein